MLYAIWAIQMNRQSTYHRGRLRQIPEIQYVPMKATEI